MPHRPKKPRAVRLRKFSPEVADAFVAMSENAYPMGMIAGLLGVNVGTLYDWIAKSEADPTGPYGDLAARVKHARASRAREILGTIEEAAIEDPRMAVTLLEKLYPKWFGRGAQLEVNVTAPAEQVQVIDVSDKSLAELEAELENGE